MSYQVLARKWRPQNFKQMVGQEHVLRALMNALDSDRLHHAYLFTGTRGVGKTTIARILAKCLNCETGITSTPCGECNSCQEIAAGNFLDLIEVDAASRTKVEDTRELLENVQYAPTRARFKVYLIDEVHMLTGHSFNALLKTLEEPPPHVKFLFATTDPQKLPATILSRCLQFNLKRMPVDMITAHLSYLLAQEAITFDEPSLRLLGRAADGSMRDALSLLDQAIAFSGAEITESAVRDMLGTISHEPLIDLLKLIIAGEGAALLNHVEDLSSVTPDFDAATDALIALLHQIAVQQVVPDAINEDDSVRDIANKISKEEVQLFYQIALQGRKDLPLSPDPRSGFEMLLLRMLSFKPLREGMQLESTVDSAVNSVDNSKKKTVELETPQETDAHTITDKENEKENDNDNDKKPSSTTPVAEHIKSNESSIVEKYKKTDHTTNQQSRQQSGQHSEQQPRVTDELDSIPPWEELPPELEAGYGSNQNEARVESKQTYTKDLTAKKDLLEKPKTESTSLVDLLLADDEINDSEEINNLNETDFVDEAKTDAVVKIQSNEQKTASTKDDKNQPWYAVVPQLNLSGRANELIKHCVLEKNDNGIISLILDKNREDLLADTIQAEIQQALMNFYGDNASLKLRTAEASSQTQGIDAHNETPAQRNERKINETQQQAENNIESDPFVRELKSRFGAQIVPGSVKAKHILE